MTVRELRKKLLDYPLDDEVFYMGGGDGETPMPVERSTDLDEWKFQAHKEFGCPKPGDRRGNAVYGGCWICKSYGNRKGVVLG